ncbi:MAG TPA: class I SAM-dependent methyltransferase [Hyphomicrobiaceae bacterium]|nr:class I SAM-dependent methyltransferase [Hyphomicrobiaceae bacterium]
MAKRKGKGRPKWTTVVGKAVIGAERVWLRDIASEVEAQFGTNMVIVNIGIFRGATMYCMRAGAPKARLVGIDTVYPQGPRLGDGLRAEVVIGDSGKCHAAFDGPVHLLFVDGDHRYEAVKADIEGWAPKVVSGGVIAFHDYAPAAKVAARHAGIKQAVDEWQEGTEWGLIEAAGSIRAYRRPDKRDLIGERGNDGRE